MSSCLCKTSFISVQVCGGCCGMFRGLTFWGTQCNWLWKQTNGHKAQTFSIDELISTGEWRQELFRKISDESHCLHPPLPKQSSNKVGLLNSLRNRGHNYTYSRKLSQLLYSRTVYLIGVCFLAFSIFILGYTYVFYSLCCVCFFLIINSLYLTYICHATVVMCAFGMHRFNKRQLTYKNWQTS